MDVGNKSDQIIFVYYTFCIEVKLYRKADPAPITLTYVVKVMTLIGFQKVSTVAHYVLKNYCHKSYRTEVYNLNVTYYQYKQHIICVFILWTLILITFLIQNDNVVNRDKNLV